METLSLILVYFVCIVWSLRELQWFETVFVCFVLDVQIVYEIKMFVLITCYFLKLDIVLIYIHVPK